MTISCIIPVYNESARVAGVLSAVCAVPEISEIICVDDGSTDGSGDVIRTQFPAVTLLKHPDNLGKTQAVITALKHVTSEVVMLMDSDLLGLDAKDVRHAIRTFENNRLDCLLLSARAVNIWDNLARIVIRLPLVVTGNRIIWKKILSQSLAYPDIRDYCLEAAQNKYLLAKSKKVAFTDISAQNVFKSQKSGIIRGFIKEIVMWNQILSYCGLIQMTEQMLFFARKKV